MTPEAPGINQGGRCRVALCFDCHADMPGAYVLRKRCEPCIRKHKHRLDTQRNRRRRERLGLSERAYRASLQGIGAPSKGKWCRRCEGMPHRRPEDGSACGCGEHWQPEMNARPLPSAGAWWWV